MRDVEKLDGAGAGDEKLNRRAALGVFSALLAGCRGRQSAASSVEFTRIPQADPGGQEKNDIIEGVVRGAKPGQRIVLYARSGKWWVQPLRTNPFTSIQRSAKWTNATHLGTEYAALLVGPDFQPATTYDQLPAAGGPVAAVAVVRGKDKPPSFTIPFSGYEWRVRDAPSNRGGMNLYHPSNVTVDAEGAIHLQITKSEQAWVCSEVSLTRSLGFGTYRFVVRDISHLDPSVVFTIFTWDYAGGSQGNREMDVELTRWGDPANQNAQYVVQPYYVPANTARFAAPGGRLTHTMRWDPGRVWFQTVRGTGDGPHPDVVAEHLFTSGVPSHGIESIRMNHYVFHNPRPYPGNASEVVVEKFEFLP
jgi:hypothetical protein